MGGVLIPLSGAGASLRPPLTFSLLCRRLLLQLAQFAQDLLRREVPLAQPDTAGVVDGGGDGGRGAVDTDLRDGLGAVRADLVVTRYQEGPKIARNVANLGRAIALQIPGERNALPS